MSQQTAPPRQALAAPRICIVGGGFGGLYTALYLQKYRHLRSAKIVLIEPKDRFLFTPMMYELLTDELKEWEIAPTYSSLLMGKNVIWKQARANAIDLQQQVVSAAGEKIGYDYLVVATGAENRPVDIPGVEQHTLTFRSLQDALRLKSRLAQIVQGQKLQLDLSIPTQVVVIGGGPSGVELSGKVKDYLTHHGLQNVQIKLVERGETILAPFEKRLRRLARKSLSRRQIEVMIETSVAAVTADAVTVETKNRQQVLPSQLTLWAAGTQPRPWLGTQPVRSNDQGQRLTRRSLQLIEYDNVFVLGDSAAQGGSSKSTPSTAQAAYQAASQVAKNLSAMTRGRDPKSFSYLHLGDMLTLGIGEAGLWSFGFAIGGWLAALCRRGVYIFRMPTRRHQIKVGRRALGELLQAVFMPWKQRRVRT